MVVEIGGVGERDCHLPTPSPFTMGRPVMHVDYGRQEELEELSVGLGAKRFKARKAKAEEKGDATRVGAGRKLLSEAVAVTSEVMEAWLAEVLARRGKRHTAVKWIQTVGIEEAAYFGCRAVLAAVGSPVIASEAAREVAQHVLDQIRVARFRDLAPALFEYRQSKLNTSNRSYIARYLGGSVKSAVCTECYEGGFRAGTACPHLSMEDLQNVTQDQRLRIGLKLIDLVLESFPGWVERVSKIRPKGSKGVETEVYLQLTEHATTWTNERNALLAELFPVALPMVVPPLHWGPNNQRGGYRFRLLGKYDMVRTTLRHRRLIDAAEIPQVYEALNRLQETPWRVNPNVYDVFVQVMAVGGERAGLPRLEPLEQPIRPAILDKDPETEGYPEALKAFKTKVTRWYVDEGERKSLAVSFAHLVSVVDLVRYEPAIWFPWTLDFRGRAYPVPTFLQPQGSDLAKGLLTFADGEPIGAEGIQWLALHTANCLDEWDGIKISTLTLEERLALVARIMPELLEVAEDPMGNRWWMDMEEPWRVLACCFEWRGVEAEGEEYVCSLPVSIDGTCNGLQHFAALLRDPVGAKAVNVAANETPHDVYNQVTQAVLDQLQTEASREDEQGSFARRWLASGQVTRKLTKRPTMTFSYGSGRYGFTDQILSHLATKVDNWEEIRDTHFTTVNEDTGEIVSIMGKCSAYLAGIVETAISQVVVGAFGARQWLQETAKNLSCLNTPVSWTVPETGFPVIQDSLSYWETDTHQVDTFLGGVRFQPKIHTRSKKVQTVRQINGISPNFIHSLDAAAMMMTVRLASHEGVEAFTMVHDSFGTIPSRMRSLANSTRQAFHSLYTTHSPVQSLYYELMDLALKHGSKVERIPDPPDEGSLDIAEVLVSDYFFA